MLSRVFFLLVVVALIPQYALSVDTKKQRIAILDFTNHANLEDQESLYLSDLVRSEVRGLLSTSSYILMTRDNIVELLPPEISMSDCIGECAIQTGRNVGADFVVSGKIVTYGGQLRISLSLHETETGNLLSSKYCGGESLMDLEGAIPETSAELLRQSPVALAVGVGKGVEGFTDNYSEWSTNRQAAAVVRFKSDPSGAAVDIDGVPSCTTEGSRALLPGRYTVTMKKLRYFARTEEVDISAAGGVIDWKLTPNYGWLSVESRPNGLPVLIDGVPSGRTPVREIEKDAGTYVIRIEDSRYYEASQQIDIHVGSRETVMLNPVPRLGAVVFNVENITGEAVDADIYIDSVKKGKAYEPITLLADKYEVTVRDNKMKWTGIVQVVEKQTSDIRVVLRDKIISDKIRADARILRASIKERKIELSEGWWIGAGICAATGIVAKMVQPEKTDSYLEETGYVDGWTPSAQKTVVNLSITCASICAVVALIHQATIPSESAVINRLMGEDSTVSIDARDGGSISMSLSARF